MVTALGSHLLTGGSVSVYVRNTQLFPPIDKGVTHDVTLYIVLLLWCNQFPAYNPTIMLCGKIVSTGTNTVTLGAYQLVSLPKSNEMNKCRFYFITFMACLS